MLFALSNITGGTCREHIKTFLEQDMLINHVLAAFYSSNKDVKSEAIWVITNAISQSTELMRA